MPVQAQLPGGFIGGVLAARAFKSNEELKQIEIDQRKQDLEQDRLAQLAQEEYQGALKAAAPRIAAEKDPVEQGRIILEEQVKYDPKGAVETLKAISFVSENMADAKKAQLESDITSANAAAVLLENVKDGASLQAMFERVQVQGIDTAGVIPSIYQLYQKEGWSPRVQATLSAAQRAVINKRDQAAIDLDAERTRTEQARRREIDARASLVPYQKKEIEARTKRAEKEGEVTTKLTARARSLASNLIAAEYYMDDSKEDLYNLSVEATEYAKDLLKNDPSLTEENAVRQAVKQMEEDLAFAGLSKKDAMPGTRQNPDTMPLSRDGTIDAGKLVENAIYKGMGKYEGKSLMWNGRMFIPVEEE